MVLIWDLIFSDFKILKNLILKLCFIILEINEIVIVFLNDIKDIVFGVFRLGIIIKL